MRIILTLFAVKLLELQWLKLIGSALLLWIGVKLLVPEEEDPEVSASDNLIAAIKTILIADLVMSLDNVIAVAAAVVLRDGAAVTERELQDFVGQRVADSKVPKKILFMEEIPKGATGKLQRIGLAKKLGLE
jgi:hypothetical protein